MKVLLLSEREIAELSSIEEVMEVVENAFREKALGYVQMPPKVYLYFSRYNGDVRAMPAYLERLNVASVKIVNSHPENPKNFGMPTVSATVLLLNPRNGSLLSIMGGNNITAARTNVMYLYRLDKLGKPVFKTNSIKKTGFAPVSKLVEVLFLSYVVIDNFFCSWNTTNIVISGTARIRA